MPRLPRELPRLPLVSLGLTLAGGGVAGYLTIVHYRPALLTCTVGGCETVQSSRYSEMAGIPVALLGLAMYLLLAALCLLRLARPALAPDLTIALFAMALAGSAYAIYLTYLEVAVIEAICQWCVLFAIVTWLLTAVEGWLVAGSIRHPNEQHGW